MELVSTGCRAFVTTRAACDSGDVFVQALEGGGLKVGAGQLLLEARGGSFLPLPTPGSGRLQLALGLQRVALPVPVCTQPLPVSASLRLPRGPWSLSGPSQQGQLLT